MKMDFILSTTTEYAMKLALLDVINKAEKDKFQEFIVVVPETKTLLAERFLLENSLNHAFANIYVYSFNRLLKKIQTKNIHPLSKEAGVMIVRNLIMALSGDLVCYKKTAGTVGFAENIYETLQQLKSSGVSPIELAETAKKCTTALRIKLEDISLIYDAYENYLAGELIDPSDKLTMLETEVGLSERIKDAEMYVVGFDALTSNACSVIKSFVKQAKSVTVSASYIDKKQKNAHIADNEVYEHLKKVADSLKIKYNPTFKKKPLSGDFKNIKENLYAYPVEKKKTNGSIKMFGAPNFDIEAKKIASLIKTDILKGESRYKDNCVFLADDTALNNLKMAFEEYEIPYFSASPYQFETHQLFVFLKLLFSLVRKNMDTDDVVNFSKCALLEIDTTLTDDFENYVLKYGINHGKFLKPFVYKDTEERFVNSENVRQKIEKVVRTFAAGYSEKMTISDVVSSLFAFFKDINIEDRLSRLREKQESLGQTRDALATKQALNKAKEVLEMLSQFLGDEKVKLDEFYTLLISGLEAADISLLPLSIDNVQIVSSPDGLYNIKNLYIMGAKDGSFPKREQDLGLIQDSEITSLEGLFEKKIEPTIKTINRRERFKVYELLQLPTNKLIISFSEHSSKGEEVKMTSLMQMIASLFYDEENEELLIEKVFNPYEEDNLYGAETKLALSLGTKKNAIKYLAENVSGYKNGEDYSCGLNIVSGLYKALENDLSEETKEKFNNINNESEVPEVKNAEKLFFPKKTTSISQLERYFSCPFQHFASYGLRLKDREMASMRALDVGDILHEVAERFVNFVKTKKRVNVDKFALNTLKNVLSKEKYSEEENRVLVRILESEAVRLCRALYDELQVSTFVPFATEKWFGRNGEYKGVLLDEASGVELVGKIDRVDQNDKYYRIIDYKTGKIDSKPEDIFYGKKLQLALYLSAISDIKKQPAGVLYFPIKNEYADSKEKANEVYRMKGFMLDEEDAVLGMDKTLTVDNPRSRFIYPELKKKVKAGESIFKANNSLLKKEHMQSLSSYALALAGKGVEEILSGYVNPAPYKSSNELPCEYCEYKKVCGIITKDYQTVREPNNKKVKEFYKGGTIWQKN